MKPKIRSLPIFFTVVISFILSFFKHFSVLLYPLSGIIFYFYLPIFYATSRMNIIRYQVNGEYPHIRLYLMELSIWFVSTCFFSFILAHFLADLFFDHQAAIYHFSYFLLTVGVVGIAVSEYYANKNKAEYESAKKFFEIQGLFYGAEIITLILIVLMLHH